MSLVRFPNEVAQLCTRKGGRLRQPRRVDGMVAKLKIRHVLKRIGPGCAGIVMHVDQPGIDLDKVMARRVGVAGRRIGRPRYAVIAATADDVLVGRKNGYNVISRGSLKRTERGKNQQGTVDKRRDVPTENCALEPVSDEVEICRHDFERGTYNDNRVAGGNQGYGAAALKPIGHWTRSDL